MIDYLASFAETNGVAFPNTLGKNATGAGATDGTEFVKLFIDDLWGARQALMDHAGLTPDGVTEAPGTAQIIEAMQRGFGGVGEWVIWTKKDVPATTGDRVLFLNGQGVLRANYVDLDTLVYVGDPANGTASSFYHADDAAGTIRNTTGVYLILPETRGYALRGLDTAAAVDPGGATRDYGNAQLDAFQGHWHEFWGGPAGASATDQGVADYIATRDASGSSMRRSSAQTNTPILNASDFVRTEVTDGVNGTPRTDSESRMVNVAVQFGIRY